MASFLPSFPTHLGGGWLFSPLLPDSEETPVLGGTTVPDGPGRKSLVDSLGSEKETPGRLGHSEQDGGHGEHCGEQILGSAPAGLRHERVISPLSLQFQHLQDGSIVRGPPLPADQSSAWVPLPLPLPP